MNSLRHFLTRCLGYALITLAMVVGTNIEYGVVLTVVPLYKFVVLAYKRKESVATLARLQSATLLNLCQKPAARDDSMSLQKLKT